MKQDMLWSQKQRESAPGYTLIEVIIVVAIIGIMTTVSLISWSHERVKSDLRITAHELTANIIGTRNKALSGKQPIQSVFPCQYVLNATAGAESASYRLSYTGHGTGSDCSGATSTNTVQSFTLPNGVLFENVWTVGYSLPFGEASFGATVPIFLSKAGMRRMVCAYPNGSVIDIESQTCP